MLENPVVGKDGGVKKDDRVSMAEGNNTIENKFEQKTSEKD